MRHRDRVAVAVCLVAVTGLLVFVAGVSVNHFGARKKARGIAWRDEGLVKRGIEEIFRAEGPFLDRCIGEPVVVIDKSYEDNVLKTLLDLAFIHRFGGIANGEWAADWNGVEVGTLPMLLARIFEVNSRRTWNGINHDDVTYDIGSSGWDSASIINGHRNRFLREVKLGIAHRNVGSLREMNGVLRRDGSTLGSIGSSLVDTIHQPRSYGIKQQNPECESLPKQHLRLIIGFGLLFFSTFVNFYAFRNTDGHWLWDLLGLLSAAGIVCGAVLLVQGLSNAPQRGFDLSSQRNESFRDEVHMREVYLRA
jgi:hypothetical protein